MSQVQRRSSEDLAHEREVLDELTKSEGWAVFCARVHAEWQGIGYFARMGLALKDPDPNIAKVVHKTSLEVTGMLDWPKARIGVLKGHVE